MKQEDVDLIYDFLHENYEYESGQLISKKNRQGVHTGKILGCYSYQNEGKDERPRLSSCITVNTKKYYVRLSHLIYIFHKKEKPLYINFKDGNVTNTKIENLIPCERRQFAGINCIKQSSGQYSTPYKTYTARLQYNKKVIFCINYHDKETARLAYIYANQLVDENEDLNKIQEKVLEKYPKPVRSKSGFQGVYKASKNRFAAKMGKEQKILGYFNTAEEAHEAYLKAKKEFKK